MDKLQVLLDQAFNSPKTPREPERPSEGFIERERAFAERARKIEALRQARLTIGESGEAPPSLLFEVVRHRGHWRIFHRNRYSAPHADQGAAIEAAKTLAKKKRDLGHTVEVRLRRTDGQVMPQPIDDPQNA